MIEKNESGESKRPKPFKVQTGEEIIEGIDEELRLSKADYTVIHDIKNMLKNKLVVDEEFVEWLQSNIKRIEDMIPDNFTGDPLFALDWGYQTELAVYKKVLEALGVRGNS